MKETKDVSPLNISVRGSYETLPSEEDKRTYHPPHLQSLGSLKHLVLGASKGDLDSTGGGPFEP